MTIEVNTQHNNNNNILSASTTKPVTAPNSIHTVSTSSNSVSCETTKQTETNTLDKALAEVLGKDYLKIKEEINRICEKLGIKVPENKVKLTEAKIKEIAEKVQKLVDSLKAKNLEINAENLFNAACYAIDTKILEKNGLTREEYEKSVKNGEAKSLRELLGLKEGEEITEEAVSAFAKKIVAESQARIKNSPNKAEAIKQELALQKKQFALCLVATSKEDRAKLFNAIEHAYAENKCEFINDIFSALTPEERLEIANTIGMDKIQALLNTPDANGNICTIDEKTGMLITISKHQNKETITNNQKEFMVQAREFFAREDVRTVQNKIKNGEELTTEEKALAQKIETYTAIQAGTQIGTANSVVLDEEAKNELLELLNRDAYELPIYRDVLNQINTFVNNEENAEYLTMPKEEVERLIDKTSNGNYSIVASDIKNGTITELNAPKDPNATSAADLGYTNKESVDTTNLTVLNAQIAEQSIPEDNTFVIEKDEKKESVNPNKVYTFKDYNEYGKAGRKAFIEKFGYRKFFSESLNGTSTTSAAKEAENIFKSFSTSCQVLMTRTTSEFKVGKCFINWMSKSALNEVNMLTSYNLTQELQETKEEKEKKEEENIAIS